MLIMIGLLFVGYAMLKQNKLKDINSYFLHCRRFYFNNKSVPLKTNFQLVEDTADPVANLQSESQTTFVRTSDLNNG